MMPYLDDMTFSQRWLNTLIATYDYVMRQLIYFPSEEELARKYFGHLGPLPTVRELVNNVSLVLANTHRALAPPRPSMPSIFILHMHSMEEINSIRIIFVFSRHDKYWWCPNKAKN